MHALFWSGLLGWVVVGAGGRARPRDLFSAARVARAEEARK